MGAVASIAGAVLNSTAKSGQQTPSQVNPVSGSSSSAISTAGNDSPKVNTADVKKVGSTPDTKDDAKKAPDTKSSSGMDWESLAKIAGQLESMTNNQVSAPITANSISQASPLANFR